MPAVRRMKIALLVSSACNSSITGSNWSRNASHALEPARRGVGRHAARRDVAVGEPGAADLLEQVEDHLPLAERPHEGRETAQIEAVAAGGHQVAGDPAQLGHDQPQVPRLFRHLQPQQLLDAQRPAEVHVHRGQIIEPVGVGHELAGREVLADLFRRAVQVADVRSDLGDDLAVGPQHQAQHAVRAGVLRPHVDQHLVGANVELHRLGLGSRWVCMAAISIGIP